MAPELQKYYEDRFAMMAMPGWRDLIDDIEKIKESLNNISVVRPNILASGYF